MNSMNTKTNNPMSMTNTYTTNSTNSIPMNTSIQTNMTNARPSASAALAQRNGPPGNRPNVKVRAELLPGTAQWYFTYSAPPFQNVQVPVGTMTVLSRVSLKTIEPNAVVWGTISKIEPNSLRQNAWQRVVYLSPAHSDDPGFWIVDDTKQKMVRRVTKANHAILFCGLLYVAYAQ